MNLRQRKKRWLRQLQPQMGESIFKFVFRGEIYGSRNSWKRARARYKIENGLWTLTYRKALNKYMRWLIAKTWEEFFAKHDQKKAVSWDCGGAKTVKITKLEIDGLPDYLPSNKYKDNKDNNSNINGTEVVWEAFDLKND